MKDEQKSESKLKAWYTITAVLNYIPQIARKYEFELMEVLMGENTVTLNENYTITIT